MHFIKYLAIFAIFAIQFSLQEVSSEESSSQALASSQEENNLPVKQTQTGKKSLLGNLKNSFNEKTSVLKAKVGQVKDKVKSKLDDTRNEINKKIKGSSKLQKGLKFANKLKDKTFSAGKSLKTKVLKLF